MEFGAFPYIMTTMKAVKTQKFVLQIDILYSHETKEHFSFKQIIHGFLASFQQ